MKHLKLIIITLLALAIFLPASTCSAQDVIPPAEVVKNIDSGTLAVVVLIIFLVERLLGKILPFITKSKDTDNPDREAIKLLCAELRKVSSSSEATNGMVKDLHAWHNVQDPKSGRMIWYGLGISNLQETMIALNANIESQTAISKEVVATITRMSFENAQAHVALLETVKELLRMQHA